MAQVRRMISLATGKDLSPNDLALLMGFKAQSTVYRWENEGAETSHKVLERLAKLSGASLDWIISGAGAVAPTIPAKRGAVIAIPMVDSEGERGDDDGAPAASPEPKPPRPQLGLEVSAGRLPKSAQAPEAPPAATGGRRTRRRKGGRE